MFNQDIRKQAHSNGVKLWEIAERLNLTDSNFSRKLRRELPKEEKEKIHVIIAEIKTTREDSGDD